MTLAPKSTDAFFNALIDQRYRVCEKLGEGGMGVVYKVKHIRLNKVAAMKLVHRQLCTDEQLLRRFEVEAEAISRLNHPNIVQVFDYGEYYDQPYLVMQFLAGEDLASILYRDSVLTHERALPILIQICDALIEAHALKIIHRDLKPENIHISRTQAGRDHVKVLDFGLAKIIDDNREPTNSSSGILVGTPYYMAPEQIQGDEIDHRVDIYALGSLMYRIFTGSYAFTAKTPVGILTKHITAKLTPPSQAAPDMKISTKVDELIGRAMAKKPNDRFENVLDLKKAMIEALESQETCPQELLSQTARRRLSDLKQFGEQIPSSLSDDTPRLTRADFELEKKIFSGRRRAIWALSLILIAIAAFLGHRYVLTPPQKSKWNAVEVEPNNTTAKATPIRLNHPIKGKLGKRLSQHASDLDWYRIRIDETEKQSVLTVEVSALPNIDIALELYDRLGGLLVSVDSTSKNGKEGIYDWPVKAGDYYILVRQYFTVDQIPSENVSDHYELICHKAEQHEYSEHEPNDRIKQARKLAIDKPILGKLSTNSDIDFFVIERTNHPLLLELSALAGVDLVLTLHSSDMAKGKKVDKKAIGQGEKLKLKPSKFARYFSVRRKERQKSYLTELVAQTKNYTISLKPR